MLFRGTFLFKYFVVDISYKYGVLLDELWSHPRALVDELFLSCNEEEHARIQIGLHDIS